MLLSTSHEICFQSGSNNVVANWTASTVVDIHFFFLMSMLHYY